MRHTDESPLLARIGTLVHNVSEGIIDSFCDILEALEADAPEEKRLAVSERILPASSRQEISHLLRAWVGHEPGMTPVALAQCVRAASYVERIHRERQVLDLVWTGPVPGATMLRRTDQALLEIIEGSQSELMIVTFAAYRVPAIRTALKEAVARGVHLTLVAESSGGDVGTMTLKTIADWGDEVVEKAQVIVWPVERRRADPRGHPGRLHVKCALADDRALFVSSANLTGHALDLNMELGVLIRGGGLPRQVGDHFRALISAGILVPRGHRPTD
jgi:phosphatidylserine/phosphatidylglycerophosphate/cardiolipin synthase-like enzyme